MQEKACDAQAAAADRCKSPTADLTASGTPRMEKHLCSNGGSNGDNGGNNLGDSLDVPCILIIFYGILGVYIIPKWLIKVPDLSQYLVNDFWNFQNLPRVKRATPKETWSNCIQCIYSASQALDSASQALDGSGNRDNHTEGSEAINRLINSHE